MKLKKILAYAMALLICSNIVVAPKTTDTLNSMVVSSETEDENVYSGSCGENATWSFDETTGTLTISGTGDMEDYEVGMYSIGMPWRYYSIKIVIIENGITSIGDNAFYNCTSLESVTIPDSVTYIGTDAFYNTPFIKNYPDDLIILGSVLYEYQGKSTNVIIPDGVTSISERAFSSCSSLESVTIPDSVTYIDENAFGSSDMMEYIPFIENYPNDLIILGNGILYRYKGNDTNITIPSGVNTINDYAFYNCTSLESVTIPNSVTTIGENAFNYCTSLESITIPDSVTTIGDYAFSGCENLTSVTIPDSVTTIGSGAFLRCSSLKDVTIPNSLTTINDSTFTYCTSLESIVIPDSVTYIGGGYFNRGNGGAFYHCDNLKDVTLSNNLTYVGVNAFTLTPYLESLRDENGYYIDNGVLLKHSTYPLAYDLTYDEETDTEIRYDRDGNIIEYEYKIFTYTYNDDDEEYTHEYKIPIAEENLIIPDGVVTIADGALTEEYDYFLGIDEPYYENGLSVTIPDSVKNINCPFDYWTNGYLFFIEYFLDAIKGYTGSTAETWANENDVTFIPLDDTNKANQINILRLKKYLLGLSYTSGELDINEDGNINILDIIALKSKTLNE